MTTLSLPFFTTPKAKPGFDIGPITRGIVGTAAIAMSLACIIALARFAFGMAPDHPALRNIPVLIHVVTVLPAVPLGAYLLVAPKGTPMHKMLGKIWLSLMVITAIAITFIRGGTDFSWIHIFVPITLHGAWKTVATARAGKIAQHKSHLVGMYLGALMIPGIFSFMPSRLMGTWLFG
ncbi:DUF2306 domain-containing protein [Parerythrobacter jejuensis]|uniref:DUF2306 domain-containing protein n=1 Tax=Parerythrobacter jejuensis TaxID=795812 RepID=A0A845AUR8_9SPHN|nr:hypothetical protein [Parerythrobacter jejuensis]MXP30479.1 hypothetical protein [Parerythrobacter jejuensis]MXP33239.1 hypothetical protein [Parerythrobacter jejuensis]